MAVVKVLARDWTLEINNGTYASPSWINATCGLNTFTFSNTKNDADTTDFCSEGWMEHIVASRSMELTGEGFYLEDESTGDRNQGQELIETLANQMGNASLGDFRLTSPGGNSRRFYASANIADVGGGNDDPTSWGFTLTISGQITTSQELDQDSFGNKNKDFMED